MEQANPVLDVAYSTEALEQQMDRRRDRKRRQRSPDVSTEYSKGGRNRRLTKQQYHTIHFVI